ncbi:MAG TPA: cell wall hydrolase [Xanthomonadaceae bacterium]|nr:cell wall hydrolase [Xanthomonadaceae bacterium]
MKLGWILWLASVLPQPADDQLCLATTIYLEARNQSVLGQQAVAEVALRRLDSGRWGDSLCEVLLKPRQFAPTLVSDNYRLKNLRAWERSWNVALEAMANWQQSPEHREYVVPDADHFVAQALASPYWAKGEPVRVIGDHSFYQVGF